MDSLLELFCHVDDFCKAFLPHWNKQLLSARRPRGRRPGLCMSEIMTILIHFHQSNYRNFKAYYLEYVMTHLRNEFPGLVSYNRFVELIPSVIMPLTHYLRHACLGTCTGITFIDSTTLAVCKNPRIHCHKTFAGLARRGKTSTGWFYGFKLHLIVNDRGELIDFVLTPGNVDDRTPVPRLARGLFGKLFGDKGYLSKALRDELWRMFKVQLITGIRANMKNTLLPLLDKLLLRRRVIVETIVDQLKNISQIEHSRHRSPVNFVVNLLCGLIAYCHRPRKPSLNLAALAG
jgi:transposase